MLKKIIKSIIFWIVNKLSLSGSNGSQALSFKNHQYTLSVFKNLILNQREFYHILGKCLIQLQKTSVCPSFPI